MRTLFVVGLLFGCHSANAEWTALRITAASHETGLVTIHTGGGSGGSYTSCSGSAMQNGPFIMGQANCQTLDSAPRPRYSSTAQYDANNVVEANGQRYTLVCMGSRLPFGAHCQPMSDGEEFDADYDGKTTMLVYTRQGGNLGKPVKIKYRVLDVRQIPPGQVTATSINAALAAARQRHPDFQQYEQAMDRVAKDNPPGAMNLDDYIEMLYVRARAGK